MQLSEGQYSSFRAITPSDATLISCSAFYVGGAGSVAISPDGATAAVVLTGALPGTVYRINLDQGRVLATGTTATGLVALL
jgi:hypothetical protein